MAKILGFGLVQLLAPAPIPLSRQIVPLSPSLAPMTSSMTVAAPAAPAVAVPSTEPTAVAPAAPPVSSPGDAPSSDVITAPQPVPGAPGAPTTLVDASQMRTMQEDMDVPGSGMHFADEEEMTPATTAPGDNKMIMGVAIVAGLGIAGYLAYSMMKPKRATPNRRRRHRRAA